MNDQPCQYLDGAEDHRLSRPSDLASLNGGLEWCDKIQMDLAPLVNQYAPAWRAATDKEVRELLGNVVGCLRAQLKSARQLRLQLEHYIPIDGPIFVDPEVPPSANPGAGTEDTGGRHD